MKSRYSVLAALAGFGIGAVTIDQLHAQAKPPVFYVAEIDMKNADAYQKEYAPKAQALIKKMGGKTLAAGSNITAIEGAAPKSRVAVQQWESIEQTLVSEARLAASRDAVAAARRDEDWLRHAVRELSVLATEPDEEAKS